MNILFITLADMKDVNGRGIYEDLLREFIRNGDHVCVVCPTERRNREQTHIRERSGSTILRVKTGNIQKTNLLEKGIATVMIQSQFVRAIKRYFKNIKFDLVLYSTPPITLAKAVNYIKKRDEARSYLMLKDIFPQNAVDLNMMSKTGPKSVLYRYFRRKEKLLYRISDTIGCMSPANVEYVLRHNPELSQNKVELCPNAIDPLATNFSPQELLEIRDKYGIPTDCTVFVYGGNLGKPQGIPFLIECLRSQKDNEKVFFLVVGSGTEYPVLEQYAQSSGQRNLLLLQSLPRDEYDRMICACDVGMVFLDHRFTIPNFPSRLLAYMQAYLPVLACTDSHTDLGRVIVEGGFGWWCESNCVKQFDKIVKYICHNDVTNMKKISRDYLQEHYCSKICYNIIVKKTDTVGGCYSAGA